MWTNNTSFTFVVLALILTLLVGFMYVAVQQSYRTSANDPQVQMAADAARALELGANPHSLVASGTVDLNRSLAPFLIVLDKDGKVIASNAELNGSTSEAVPPMGTLDSANLTGENRVTWQPENGVRIATVIRPYSNGYVVSGRSLAEAEKRIDTLTAMAATAWIIGIVLSLVFALVAVKKSS